MLPDYRRRQDVDALLSSCADSVLKSLTTAAEAGNQQVMRTNYDGIPDLAFRRSSARCLPGRVITERAIRGRRSLNSPAGLREERDMAARRTIYRFAPSAACTKSAHQRRPPPG